MSNYDEYTYIFDATYFEGKIYVYFGILPALILLVPIKLLTGLYIGVSFGTFIFLAIGEILTVKLFSEIIYRYYKHTPFYLVILMCIFLLFNNKILWVLSRPAVYEFVVSAGYCFIMAGMYYFFKYLRTRKENDTYYIMLINGFISCLQTNIITNFNITLE